MLKKYLKYIHDNPHGYWFKRKMYGWGWTPAKWQGWVMIALYIGLIIFLGIVQKDSPPPKEVGSNFILPVIFLTVILILICYKKGEKPKWQWGGKR